MINHDIMTFFNNTRQALLSLFFCSTGEAIGAVEKASMYSSDITVAFQHTAWTIGIIAGIVGIVNGIQNIIARSKGPK